jgi:hypothetical protein
MKFQTFHNNLFLFYVVANVSRDRRACGEQAGDRSWTVLAAGIL